MSEPDAVTLEAEGAVAPDALALELAGDGRYALVAGSRTALVGAGAEQIVAALGRRHRAALLLADRDRPLHAAHSVGDQIAEALGGTRRAAYDRATDLLESTGVPEPHDRVAARPHELSVLDRQRAQLALALANEPALVIGEDPSAGLGPADAAAFAAAVTRMHGRLNFTFVMWASERSGATRLVQEILILTDGRITERQVRRAQSSSSSST